MVVRCLSAINIVLWVFFYCRKNARKCYRFERDQVNKKNWHIFNTYTLLGTLYYFVESLQKPCDGILKETENESK